jgi:hypothetical protein
VLGQWALNYLFKIVPNNEKRFFHYNKRFTTIFPGFKISRKLRTNEKRTIGAIKRRAAYAIKARSFKLVACAIGDFMRFNFARFFWLSIHSNTINLLDVVPGSGMASTMRGGFCNGC